MLDRAIFNVCLCSSCVVRLYEIFGNIACHVAVFLFVRLTQTQGPLHRAGVPNLGYICLSEGVHLWLEMEGKYIILFISKHLHMYQ